jgi:hypothetical protein
LRVAKQPGKNERDSERAKDRQNPAASGFEGPHERTGSPALASAVALNRLGSLPRFESLGSLRFSRSRRAGLTLTALRHQTRAAGGEHR